MKINTTIINYWLGQNIKNEDIINKLTYLGFETFQENNNLNINIPYNRSNCNNLFNIFQELSGVIDLNFFYRKILALKNITKIKNTKFKIINKYKNFCYAYNYILINNINNNIDVNEEIKNTLIDNQIASHNFIVDLLNYITLITGQPLHAYDKNVISGNLIIDKIKNTEKFLTINNNEITLEKKTYVIKDENNNILSLPGIIGSDNAKINKHSKNIIIEIAFFNKKKIMHLSNFYNIKTIASEIFSKGLNLTNSNIALNILMSYINNNDTKYYTKTYINFNLLKTYINLYKKNILNTLGFCITDDIIELALKNRQFFFEKFDNYWKVQIPYHRSDITIEANIIAEILKWYDYKKIPEKHFKSNAVTASIKKNYIKYITNYLCFSGFNEVINYTFVNELIENKIVEQKLLILKNPLSDNMNAMRYNLLQGLLKNIASNLNRNIKNLKFFEIGNVWPNNNVKSKLNVACICTDILNFKTIYNENYSTYYILKSLAENIIRNIFKKNSLNFKKKKINYFEKELSSVIFIKNKKIGSLGLLNNEITKLIDIKEKIYFLEINLDKLKINKKPTKFKSISKFPKIERDVSFIVNLNINYQDLYNYIKLNKTIYLKNFFLVSVYHIDKTNKSISIKFIFQSLYKTLLDNEVNTKIKILCDKIKKNFFSIIKGC